MRIDPPMTAPPTEVVDHGARCCAAARALLIGVHNAMGGDDRLSLGWIGERFEWGPVRWPLAWCELPDMSVGDCGVHAAVGAYVLESAGMSVHRVQMWTRASEHELRHWRSLWASESAKESWLGREACYHECVAVGKKEVRVLDTTERVEWTDPATDGIVAMRIAAPHSGVVEWGAISLVLNEWATFASP